MNYKEGDIVEVIDNTANHCFNIGDTLYIMFVSSEEQETYAASIVMGDLDRRVTNANWSFVNEEDIKPV